jgi:hypothetical protein
LLTGVTFPVRIGSESELPTSERQRSQSTMLGKIAEYSSHVKGQIGSRANQNGVQRRSLHKDWKLPIRLHVLKSSVSMHIASHLLSGVPSPL